jgi:hypothetical protein
MKPTYIVIIVLVAVIAILLLTKGCGQPKPKPDIITKIDTTYIKSTDTVYHHLRGKTVYQPYSVYVEVGVPANVDTAAILADYFMVREYADSAYNDSVKIHYSAVVNRNALKSMELSYKLTLPQMVVTKSSTLTVNKQLAFIGLDLTSNGTNLGIYPSIYFDTRYAMWGAGYDPLNRSVKFGVYRKIKLWNRK